MSFVWFLEQTAIISLNKMNRLISAMEARCVFFEVESSTVLPNFVFRAPKGYAEPYAGRTRVSYTQYSKWK
jgi:hypothetical protein